MITRACWTIAAVVGYALGLIGVLARPPRP